MGYPILTLEKARKAYEIAKECIEPDWPSLEEERPSLGALTVEDFLSLGREIDTELDSFRPTTERRRFAEMEGFVGCLLHQSLTDQAALSDSDFWRWLSLRPLREVVLRRAARSDDSMPSQREFGLEAITESFLYRAWLRADIGFDPEAPPSARYRLAMRGDQDFWRSFVIRTRLGYHRHLVHALVEFQYPDGVPDGVLKAGDKEEGIRMLAKRLARTQANTAYAVLSREECARLVRELAEGLMCTDGTTYSNGGRAWS